MAQWRKVVVSGSSAVLNQISASGDIVPISDAGSSLGSSTREWNNLYIDGTANIDSLVADTADINGGTVDGITSLTAGGNLDIGAHGFRANTLTADAQTDGRVAIYSTAGLLSEDSDLTFSGATLSATNLTTTGTIKDFSVASGSATSTGSFGAIIIDEVIGNWTNAGNTIANLGTVTTATSITATDLIGTNVDGILGADTARAITGTTIDATTDFTIDGLVLTADTITNDAALSIVASAGDITLDPAGNNVLPGSDSADSLGASGTAWAKLWVDDIDLAGQGSISMGGTAGRIDLDADDDTSIRSAADDVITVEAGGVDILEINASSISGSSISTGSFGRVIATTLKGDGSGITGLTSAAIDTVAAMTNNYVITATAGTAVTGEANLQFDGTDLLVGGGGKVAFRDNGGEYIYSVSDNVLGLAAGSEIDLTATTIDINGLVDISGNLTVGGDLDVNGTTTTIDTVNLLISESFATYASGSSTAVDGGFGVQYHLDGRARSYGWDASATRWSFQNDLNVTGSIISPDAYVATVETGTGDGDSQGNPTYGGATGYGNIYVDTDDGEIWIFA